MADILPGYTYDNGRYRDQATGKFVSRDAIIALVALQIESAEARYRSLATALHEGKIAPAVWAEQMATEERRLALQSAALAVGGFDRLTFADYGRAGQVLRDQYGRIVGTAADAQAKTVTLPQLLNRVVAYAGVARMLYHLTRNASPRRVAEGVTRIQRRRLDAQAEHCQNCLEYAARGWQPMGALPAPGEACQCGGHCRCSLLEKDVPTADLSEWIGTTR